MTGWTWDEVETSLNMPRLVALHKEWRLHPPMPLLFAAYLGYTPQKDGTPQDLVQRLQGLSGVVQPGG